MNFSFIFTMIHHSLELNCFNVLQPSWEPPQVHKTRDVKFLQCLLMKFISELVSLLLLHEHYLPTGCL